MLVVSVARDNLLTASALELFDQVKKENHRELAKHLIQNHREKIKELSYMDPFNEMLELYDNTQGYTVNLGYFPDTDDEPAGRPVNQNTGANGTHYHRPTAGRLLQR